MEEVWVRVPGMMGVKEVSLHGRIRNGLTGQILKQRVDRNGYMAICLYKEGAKRPNKYRVHRLVAKGFLPELEGRHHVNHIDFDKTNNNVQNLEWCTPEENVKHYYENKFKGLISNDGVLYLRQSIDSKGARIISEELGISEGYVLSIANGREKANIHTSFIRPKRISLPKSIMQYDLEGNFISYFPSITSAVKANGFRIFKIQRVLNGQRKSYKGFTWKYAE